MTGFSQNSEVLAIISLIPVSDHQHHLQVPSSTLWQKWLYLHMGSASIDQTTSKLASGNEMASSTKLHPVPLELAAGR